MSDSPSRVCRSTMFLAAILLLGGLLRISGMAWGMPNALHPSYTYHPDELPHLIWARWLFTGTVIPKHFMYGGTFYFSTLKLFDLLGGLLTHVDSRNLFFNVVLVGRLTNLLYGLGAIVLAYLTGRTLYNRRAGLLAGFLLALYPAHVFWAQRIRPDELFTLLAVANLYLAARLLKKVGTSSLNLKIGGALVGVSIAARFPAAVYALPYLTALVYLEIEEGRSPLAFFAKRELWVGVFCCFAAYFLASPFTFFYFKEFLTGMLLQWHYQNGAFPDAIGRGPGWYQYGGRMLAEALGYGGYLLALPALVRSAVRRDRADLLLLSLFLPYFLMLSLTSWVVVRYTLPLLPILALFSGSLLDEWLGRSGRNARIIATATIAMVAIYSLAADLAYAKAIRVDTRDRAAIWLKKAVPAGSRIGTVINYKNDIFENPPNIPGQNWFCMRLDDAEPGLVREFLKQPMDYLVINKDALYDAKRLGAEGNLENHRDLYKWLQSPTGFRVVKRFPSPVKLAGFDFSSQFDSQDYRQALPDIVILRAIHPADARTAGPGKPAGDGRS